MIRPVWMLLALLALAGCAGLSSGKDGQAPSASIDRGALLAAADATRAAGRLSEAVQIYQQVLLGDPGSAPAQYGMAESLLGLGRAADAKPLFVGLAKQSALRPAALQGAGIADLALRKYEDAAGSLREAVAADAKLWRAYN